MGFRFRRSVRVFPGLRINLGKRGASMSIGGRGAHVTVGHGKVRETVGLPGTGLSYTTIQSTREGPPAVAVRVDAEPDAPVVMAAGGWRIWLCIATIAAAAFLYYVMHKI